MPVGMRKLLQVGIGERYGRGIVVNPEVRTFSGQQPCRGVTLRCDCGNAYTVPIYCLVSSDGPRVRVESCGCALTEARSRQGRATGKANRRHGMWGHPLYDTWSTMMRRCHSPQNPKYPRYGGRGIAVFEPWHDVAAFVAWIEANLGPRPDGMTLDRWPDNDGNYEPGNVRWATPQQQTDNREYQRAMAFLAWARVAHPEVVTEWEASFGTRIGHKL